MMCTENTNELFEAVYKSAKNLKSSEDLKNLIKKVNKALHNWAKDKQVFASKKEGHNAAEFELTCDTKGDGTYISITVPKTLGYFPLNKSLLDFIDLLDSDEKLNKDWTKLGEAERTKIADAIKELKYDGFFNYEDADETDKTYQFNEYYTKAPSIGLFDKAVLTQIGILKHDDFESESVLECFRMSLNYLPIDNPTAYVFDFILQ